MNGLQPSRALAALAVAGSVVLVCSGLALASGTGQHDVSRIEDTKGQFPAPLEIATTGPAEVVTSHSTIAPGGHVPWHYHPGPHMVTVKQGTLKLWETDCTSTTYTAGQSFYDPGPTDHPHVHIAQNPEAAGDTIIAATDVRDAADKRPTVVVDPQPTKCFDSAAGGVGQLGVTRVEDAKGAMTDLVAVKTATAPKMITGRTIIAAGGHTAWHYHPGPHLVTVRSGTIKIFMTDCMVREVTAGQAFFDPGRTAPPFIHTAFNMAASGDAEMVITDLREADERLLVAADPQPATCPGAVAAAVPQPSDVLPKTS